MKKIQCEMCGEINFIKQDGVFVCQSCGMKYSVEEAKKMMIEGTVEVQGNVQVQNAAQLENLLKLAHSSFESKNYAQAENFCNQVIAMDDKNYNAWKLKGEAINYQINAQNPRILEVFNCIMTSYRVLDDEGKEKNKFDILSSIKTCFEGEIDFWLDQVEAQRPSSGAINKVKSTFNDSISKVVSAFSEMGFDTGEEYKINLTNHFISRVNVKCVSTWKTTVGYNYYRDSFENNNHSLDYEKSYYSIIWKGDDYRPDNGIFSTFIDECDNLIDLLLFAANLFNDETEKDDIITTYENIIFLNSHAIFGRSFKRMVSTTTNGYGAVTDRREYWELDKVLTDATIRKENNKKYKQKIVALVPEYQDTLDKENKKKELEQKISTLNSQINGIVTERKASGGCLGYILFPIGIIMLVGGFALMSLDGETWPILVAIPELIIGGLCLKKTPSEEVIQENIKKKQQLIDERDNLQKELDSLN